MWDEVVATLNAEGHAVVAPTFSDGDLDTHVRELDELIPEGAGTTLIAHSYGGMVATGVSAARTDAIRKVIYLDAFVPSDGQSAFDVLPDIKELLEGNASPDGHAAPLPLSAFGITDEKVAASIEARLRPWPLLSHQQPSAGLPRQVDRVYLQFAQGDFFTKLAAELENRAWPGERLDLAHLAPITHPAETLAALRPHIAA